MNTQDKINVLIERGMSQHDIKRGTGISQASISRIIKGTQVDLRVSTVEAINRLYRSAIRRKV